MTQRTTAGVLIVVVLALGAVLLFYAVRSQTPATQSSPTPTAAARSATAPASTAAIASATPTVAPTAAPTAAGASPCDTYQTGDTPIVALRPSGRWLKVALDAVRPGQTGHNRWALRFTLATDASANAEIPLNVTVTGPNGPLEVFGYSAAPPNAGDAPVTQPITLRPCQTQPASSTFATGAVVLIIETTRVTSGTYTITAREIRRPEGDRVSEAFTVALTCTTDPGPAAGMICR